jgi:ketosteroid isomerase-like protein
MRGGDLEQNKAVARAVFDAWSTGELERLDELVAADVVHHDPRTRTAPTVSQG